MFYHVVRLLRSFPPGCGTQDAEEEVEEKEHKDMPRQHLDLASRHACNANTNTKHGFQVGDSKAN